MKAWARVCTLLVVVFVMAAVNGEGAEKKRPGICPDGKKACQVGENSYVCVDPDDECPDPEKSRGICPDDKKTCQVGENTYTCVDLDDDCP